MISTRVKICGLTSVADASSALEAGADALGMVFYKPSPRYINYPQAKEITTCAGPLVTLVGLFVNPGRADVEAAIRDTGINLLQFHGDEPEEFCKSFTRPYIKAIRMAAGTDSKEAVKRYPSASGLLFDAWQEDKYGGTGKTFDWQRLGRQRDYPLILAGGLTPDNVAQAIAAVRPYAVDVSGGVEKTPGVKDPDLVKRFICNAKNGAAS